MPICIECSYPVPQLYHVSQSTSKRPSSSAGPSVASSAGPSPTTSFPASNHITSTSHETPLRSNALRSGGEAKRTGAAARDVRLMQCPRCKRFADKYVEHDFVVLFIDLVLVKPQVYRHLLFNRLGREDDAFDPSIIRLGTLLLLFDVYLTWSAIEALPSTLTAHSPIPRLSILGQYAFFLVLSTLSTLAQHVTIRALARLPQFRLSSPPSGDLSRRDSGQAMGSSRLGSASEAFPANAAEGRDEDSQSPVVQPSKGLPAAVVSPATPTAASASSSTPAPSLGAFAAAPAPPPPPPPLPAFPVPRKSSLPPSFPSGSAISTALFVSSCMKLFPILMVVWRYDAAPPATSPAPSSALRAPAPSAAQAASLSNRTVGAGQAIVARGVAWAVAVQNLEALRILTGVSHIRAAALVCAGMLAQSLVAWALLGAVGLGEAGREVIDLGVVWRDVLRWGTSRPV